ncbi:gem-associated protein 2-like [Ixodes scapularis]|uniref:gem-associated protein 2-like n=1 Tax=Ixodes scapularis TaxID=6945 RepID=UPI001A9E55CA|nr:gem-associated protein 2-like [Ixodes scapularis]
MGFTGIALLLVSLAFLGSAADEECSNGTRPTSQKDREGCDYYCWNDGSNSWDQYFFGDNEPCFYKEGGLKGTCKEGNCYLDDNSPTENPKTGDDGEGDNDDDNEEEEEEEDEEEEEEEEEY